MRTEIRFESRRILAAVGRGNLKALRQAGAYIRKVARHAVSRSAKASLPGRPPHTRQGLLKRAVLFGVEARREAVLIGPAASLIGSVMAAHEFGGRFRGRNYPKRPLMGPSLEQSKHHLPALWKDVMKE